jgi:hypothetical protein
MMNFVEDLGVNGHLTIIKRDKEGNEEILLDDANTIVSGMGVGLSYLFTGSGSDSILDYQIDRFQVGVSGPHTDYSTEPSSIYSLSGNLTSIDEYGTDNNLVIVDTDSYRLPTGAATASVFALIPQGKITRISNNSVRYTLVLDEESCNDLTGAFGEEVYLNEIGMFFKNPTGILGNNISILSCYRTFSNIRKTNDFSLIFRWTINF